MTVMGTAVDGQRISSKGEKDKGVGQYRSYNIEYKLNKKEHYDQYRIVICNMWLAPSYLLREFGYLHYY